jgi:hypothetical protein
MMGDLLLDLDFALSQIGVHNRDMELADAYYMVNKYGGSAEENDGRLVTIRIMNYKLDRIPTYHPFIRGFAPHP